MEDKSVLIFFIALVIISALGISLLEQAHEIKVLKAKCIKVGVATMTYDINTGKEKFIFEVPNNEKQAVSGSHDN